MGLQPCHIGDELAKMVVVGGAEHVLDHDQLSVGLPKQKVRVVATDRRFRSLVGQIQTECLAQEVCLVREPRRELAIFFRPEVAHRHLF